jgi:hypothetical protein
MAFPAPDHPMLSSQLFRSASRRPERAGRPFHPFQRQPLNVVASGAVSRCAPPQLPASVGVALVEAIVPPDRDRERVHPIN